MGEQALAGKAVADTSSPTPRPSPTGEGLLRRIVARLNRRYAAPAVRFVASFFGPVFEVDLRSCSRSRRTYSIRVLYLALLILAIAAAWQGAVATARYNPAQGMLSLGTVAPALLLACGWFQLIALTLLGPVLTSSALLLERTRRTLPLLLVTPLSAWNIVASKLMSRSIQLLILSALSLPALASVQVYGGIETLDVLGTLALGLANGLFAASIGLAVSTTASSPGRATLTSYGVLVGLYLLIPAFAGWAALFLITVLSVLVTPWFSVPSTSVAMAAISPFASMVALHAEVMSPGTLGVGGVFGGKIWLWAPNLLLLLAGTWMALVVAAGRLRRLAESDPTMQEILARAGTNVVELPHLPSRRQGELASREAGEWRKTRSDFTLHSAVRIPHSSVTSEAALSTPAPEAPKTQSLDMTYVGAMLESSRSNRPRSRAVGDNAILWRELNRRRPEQSGWTWVTLGVAAYLLLLVYLPAGFNGQWASGDFHGTMTMLYLGVLAVATAALAAPAIASEKETSCWPLLLSTPLTGRQILGSKGRVVFDRVLPFSAILVGHVTLFTLLGYLHPIVLVQTALVGGAVVLFMLIVGMWFSLKVQGSARATVSTFLVGLFGWLLLPALASGFDEITWSGGWATPAALSVNPFYMMFQAASVAARSDPITSAGLGGGFTATLFLVSASYLVGAGALAAYFVRRFNYLVGRTS